MGREVETDARVADMVRQAEAETEAETAGRDFRADESVGVAVRRNGE